ncbi:glycosyltransferase family 2 protein [Patulibacter sp. NPDC049589]|uniref:glycosyltransferase family 2 protein n=1 Tax=Patulibacter sp. NPDC049589 TaxID=3154731 RepID=UPI00343C5B69
MGSNSLPHTLVSVVIPTRNRLPMLRLALSSVFRQTHTALEVIVVDEASSDGTSEWLASIDDSRLIPVRHEQPKKLPAARNAGLNRARGEYIAFLDDDDLWAPQKIELQLSALASTKTVWNVSGSVVVDDSLAPTQIYPAFSPETIRRRITVSNVVPAGGSGVMAKTSVLRDVGGFDESLVASEDWECWIRLSAAGAVSSIPEPLVAYRRAPGSMSHDLQRMETSYYQVRALHGSLPASDEREARRVRSRYYARQLFLSGRRLDAARALADRRSAKPLDFVLAFGLLIAPRSWEKITYLIRRRLTDRSPLEVPWLGAVRDQVESNTFFIA